MILYIDETENDNYFIVTGLLVTSKQNVDMTYKRFKKKVNAMNLPPKRKEKIFNEFKSVILDREFQKIKKNHANRNNEIKKSNYLFLLFKKRWKFQSK